ncbi:BatA domain-containing protein [Fodinicola feengrottensis]|uniref:BatA domain-containing protein n=1 Tax=Fodinicola feengrottensis TaxID=435914 RepID=UPI0024428BF3|nr:BatA domain-containing protein [Fodinicola feengrottensis]
MIRFLSPWWLLLVLAVLALVGGYVWMQLRRKTYAVRFSNVSMLARIAPKAPGWRRHLAATAFLLCMLVLSTGMAKPSADVRVPAGAGDDHPRAGRVAVDAGHRRDAEPHRRLEGGREAVRQ